MVWERVVNKDCLTHCPCLCDGQMLTCSLALLLRSLLVTSLLDTFFSTHTDTPQLLGIVPARQALLVAECNTAAGARFIQEIDGRELRLALGS